MAAIAAILARYPEEVITTVTHPATGLPSAKSWLPTVKEVADACAKAVLPMLEKATRDRDIAEQLAERKRVEETRRPTLEELHAKYGKDWGLTIDDRPKDLSPQTMTKEQLKHHYQHFGLAFQPKDIDDDRGSNDDHPEAGASSENECTP